MFPDLKNKKFLDVSKNEVYVVKDQFENIAILNDNQRVDVMRLLDRSYYDEYIDPKDFFNQSNLQIFADKIKSIPNETLQNLKDDDNIVMPYDPEEEKRLLEKKARDMYKVNNNSIQSQIDKFKDILDEDIPVVEFKEEPKRQDFVESITTPTLVSQQTTPNTLKPHQVNQIDDPMISMFKNIKRNNDFKISIDIINKIPRPDFIEMMEDSYEVSIIDYLAKEFTKSVMENPSMIEDKIKEEIKNIVYKKKTESVPNPSEEDQSKKKTSVDTDDLAKNRVYRPRKSKKEIKEND